MRYHFLITVFSLSHNNRNHDNTNLGDCMDYTRRPHGNLTPGKYNHELLALMYGTIPPAESQPEEGAGEPNIPSEFIKEKYKKGVKKIEENDNKCNKRGFCVEDLGGGYKLVGNKLLIGRGSAGQKD